MAFDAYSATQNESSNKPEVDFEALNQYVVETADLQERTVLTGYVAGIVDLGTQEQEDAEVEFNGSSEDEVEAIMDKPDTYFKDGVNEKGKKVRMKCWPQKPIQSVALAIDFPQIMLNKGQFFGDDNSEEKPLRLWMGGQFYLKDVGMVVGRPIPLKVVKNKDNKWSFKDNHSLYKMAVGARIIKPGEVFLPKDIDKLLGESLQFETQVFFKESKGKQYYTEYIKFNGALGRGQKAEEVVDTPFLIQFNSKNDETSLKELRNHVVNTIRRASNYEGSAIQKQLDEIKPAKQKAESPPEQKQTPPEKTAAPMAKPKRVATPVPASDIDDDDIPF